MFKHELKLAFFLIIALCTTSLSQDSKLMWLGEYISFSELPILQPAYSNYSEDDLDNLRVRLKTLRSRTNQKEWEGRFIPGDKDGVGFSVLDLSLQSGFASFYIYTCIPELQSIDYGSVVSKSEIVDLISEVPPGSPRKPNRVKLVKVKWEITSI
jgi:hypothetical protein